MAQQNRSSVLAIREETTENSLLFPTAASQYVALQSDFDVNPAFEELTSEEIRSSIGKTKSILGLERPTFAFSHYLRASGVEGQAPAYSELLKGVFGASTTQSTERTTAAASTVSIVKLAAGGTDYALGKAILLKDGTNGYAIRPIDSVATNDLTLGFDLAAAPAAGITCGKFVNFSPANSGHPTLSLVLYRSNGGFVEAISGCRVNQMQVSVTAGQLINANYSLEGQTYYFDPIEIDATNNKLNFTDDDGTFTATIPSDIYRNPIELASAIESAMETANSGETKTVTYSSTTGKFNIKSSGTVLSLLWKTGSNGSDNTDTHIGSIIGYSDAADDTGTAATTGYTSDNAITLSAPQTPTYDSADPQVAKSNEVLLGDSDDNVSFCVSNMTLNVTNNLQTIPCISSDSGIGGYIIESRDVTVDMVSIIDQYDADKFNRFKNNTTTKFLFNFGSKSGGNWVAGTCVSIYIPTSTISSFKLGNENGLVTMEASLRAFVPSTGDGEVFLNFL